jgi:hypothetical protein
MRRNVADWSGYRALARGALVPLLFTLVASLAACRGGTNGTTAAVGAASAVPNHLSTPAADDSGPLRVTITSPANETVVSLPQVDVVGQAAPEAVITINDTVVVVVGASGQFSATVPLQEGPNELDVLASDTDGNQANARLIVTYDPPG